MGCCQTYETIDDGQYSAKLASKAIFVQSNGRRCNCHKTNLNTYNNETYN